MNQIKQLLAQLSIEELDQLREEINTLKAKKVKQRRLNRILTGETNLYQDVDKVAHEAHLFI